MVGGDGQASSRLAGRNKAHWAVAIKRDARTKVCHGANGPDR